MQKKVVIVKKEVQDRLCKQCGRLIIVSKAKPQIIETNKSIIHCWNYGHQHKRIFEFVNNKQMQVENSQDFDYE